MTGFLDRLRQRKLVQWALAYVAGAFAFLQGIDIVATKFGWPESVERILIVAMCVGFFLALLLAWYHGEQGRQRASGTELLLIALVLAVGGGFLWKFARNAPQPSAPSAAVAVAAPNATQPFAAEAHSIAVLPFVDMSQAHDQEYFSDGLSEELLNQLAQLSQLRVIARTSSFSFKGKEVDVATIARVLNVANVLEGSVRKDGDTLRITAQLIRTSDSSHLWSRTYDRKLTDVFKVQDEISTEVVNALKLKLLPSQKVGNTQGTDNIEAYNQYLLGNQFDNLSNPGNWQRAMDAYRRAIALDPNYAAAYSALASAEGYLGDSSGDSKLRDQALVDASRAIALAPGLSDGYVTRGISLLAYKFDWRGGQADLETALALNPGNSQVQLGYGRLMIILGRVPEAAAALRKAVTLDPLSGRAWAELGRFLYVSGQHAEARQALDRALQISPESGYAHFHRGNELLLSGKQQDALANFLQTGAVYGFAGVAMAQYSLGHAAQSQQALDDGIAKYSQGAAYQVAEVYAWRGEKDKAFEWLDRAYVQHDGGLTFIKADPLLDRLKSDPRFPAFMMKIGLPE